MTVEPRSVVREVFKLVALRIITAKDINAAVILMMEDRVLRAGVQRYLIEMLEKGYLSCIAMNGAGVTQGNEFALIGETTKSVARYIQDGCFGLWQETSRINEIVSTATKEKIGLGEPVVHVIDEEQFPYRNISILAACYRFNIPIKNQRWHWL